MQRYNLRTNVLIHSAVEGVKIENYYLKTTGEEAYRPLSKQFITDAFTLLTELVGPYVRDSFVMVEGTSNMEYSGIADVSGMAMFTEDLSDYSSAYKYTIHEITHQWFYYAVGNNENRESWIDEGITTFLTSEIMCNDTESYHLLKEYYLELLTKYNDSEEIRKLIEFYFPGDIVNELFAS